jgi:Family of unknown function (DUF6339)
MPLLYPQIQRLTARMTMSDAKSGHLDSGWQSSHPDQTYSPLGGRPATTTHIEDVRRAILAALPEINFAKRGTTQQKGQFDTAAATTLRLVMDVSAYEASQEGVWQFMCCSLMPDLVRWRFGGTDGRVTEDRYIGLTRNTFGRLWWRARILEVADAPKPTYLLDALSEDELVQIMERPTLSGNCVLAVAIATGFVTRIRTDDQLSKRLFAIESGRQSLMRNAAKRILRSATVLTVDAMSQKEIEQFAALEIDYALEALLSTREL